MPTLAEQLEVLADNIPKVYEAGQKSVGSSGGKLYLHRVIVGYDYSFEDGPVDEGELCYFYSYNSNAITSLSEISKEGLHFKPIFYIPGVGLGPYLVEDVTLQNSNFYLSAREFDGGSQSVTDFHSWHDTVTEVI